MRKPPSSTAEPVHGHLAERRPRALPHPTLTAYAPGGHPTGPKPDPGVNLTAHVAVDSVAALVTGTLTRQRDVLPGLGITLVAARPESADSDPDGYLRALQWNGDVAELSEPGGLGDFWWIRVHR